FCRCAMFDSNAALSTSTQALAVWISSMVLVCSMPGSMGAAVACMEAEVVPIMARAISENVKFFIVSLCGYYRLQGELIDDLVQRTGTAFEFINPLLSFQG